ncbi:MAG: DUF6056 family protein [Rikenellaceae bacterium]
MKELQKEYKVALIMLPILVLFYLLNCVTNLHSDDHFYKFICDGVNGWPTSESLGIESLSDIFRSQYNHYFTHSGRVVIHSIVQGFCGIWGKGLFNILNVAIFTLLTFLTVSLVDRSLVKNYKAWACVTISIVLLIPAHFSFYYSIAFAVNYLWGLTFCVSFIYIWRYYEFRRWVYTIPLFVLCFLFGWSQESFSLPIAGALCVYYLINYREILTQRCLLSFAFCCGALMLIIAPGNWSRAVAGGGFDLSEQLVNIVRFIFRNYLIILPLVIGIVITMWHFKLRRVWMVLKEYQLYSLIFLFSKLLTWIFPVGGRVLIGLYYLWLLLFAIIILRLVVVKSKSKYNVGFWGLYIVSLFMIAMTCYYSYIQKEYEDELIEEYINSDSGLVFLDAPYTPKFLSSSYYDPRSSRNRSGISLVYSRESKPAIFVDESVRDSINEMLSSTSSENEISGGLVVRKTDMLFTYIIKDSELIGDYLLITQSENEGDGSFKRSIVEKIQPSRYQNSHSVLHSSVISFVQYNGERIGIFELSDDDCMVLSITPLVK